jgi:citrate lyase subunit alpha/citrate CoA-transferase
MGYAFLMRSARIRLSLLRTAWSIFLCARQLFHSSMSTCNGLSTDIGDPAKIGAGAARVTRNPRDSSDCAAFSGRHRGFPPLQRRLFVPNRRQRHQSRLYHYLSEKNGGNAGIKASFALGGMTSNSIDMFHKGQVRVLECSQSFDSVAARQIAEDPNIS